MPKSLRKRSLLTVQDLTRDEFQQLLDLAGELKRAKRERREVQHLRGKVICLIFEKTSTRTRCAFEVAAYDQGAHVTYIDPNSSQMGHKESVKDTARVLGRMFDAIEFRGFSQAAVEEMARFSGVPVYNGLTDQDHPTQMLADVMTMAEHVARPTSEIRFAYLGDTRSNMGRALMHAGAIMGMDIRLAGPKVLWPDAASIERARASAERHGGRLLVTEDADLAVRDVDFIHTDVWLSMGEPEDAWDERIRLLLPYQVDAARMRASGNPDVRFMHCLPAFHDLETRVGRMIHERFGLDAMEVTDEVFESPASVVFDQAENRMHTIKALLVATLAD